jgi:hypothetical protein
MTEWLSITDPRNWERTHPCIFCGVHLGCSQRKNADGSIETTFEGGVCDTCYDATYPTPETSAKALRSAT